MSKSTTKRFASVMSLPGKPITKAGKATTKVLPVKASKVKVVAKAKPSKANKTKRDLSDLQVPSSTIADTAKVKAIKLDEFRDGSAIRARFAKVKAGMTVAAACALNDGPTRFDFACHTARGRVQLSK